MLLLNADCMYHVFTFLPEEVSSALNRQARRHMGEVVFRGTVPRWAMAYRRHLLTGSDSILVQFPQLTGLRDALRPCPWVDWAFRVRWAIPREWSSDQDRLRRLEARARGSCWPG